MSKPINQDLLPCPCCSGADLQNEPTYIMCNGCGLMIDRCDAPGNDFRAAWNTRAAVQPAGVAVPSTAEYGEAVRRLFELDADAKKYCAEHWLLTIFKWTVGRVCEINSVAAPHPVSGERLSVKRYGRDEVADHSDVEIVVPGLTHYDHGPNLAEALARLAYRVAKFHKLDAPTLFAPPAAQDVAGLVEAPVGCAIADGLPEDEVEVIIYTEGTDFARQQFFQVHGSDLNPNYHDDEHPMREECQAATHWISADDLAWIMTARRAQQVEQP